MVRELLSAAAPNEKIFCKSQVKLTGKIRLCPEYQKQNGHSIMFWEG